LTTGAPGREPGAHDRRPPTLDFRPRVPALPREPPGGGILRHAARRAAARFFSARTAFDADSLERLRLSLAVAAALRLADADENLRVLDAFPDWVRECRRVARGEAIGFRTSGSTGEPRTIAHDVAALAQEVEALRENLDIWMTDRLTAPQRPRAFSFGPSLPSDDRGKPCDWPASARPAPSAPP
jgi:hypothetical protein